MPVIVVRVLVAIVALAVIYLTLGSAVRTVVLPRGVPAKIGRAVFIGMRMVFRVRAGRNATYEKRDAVMASYGPVSLLVLLGTWMVLVFASYVGLYWATGAHHPRDAFELSGSSLFTLGFDRPGDGVSLVMSFTESALGLFLLALLITYLPSLYQAFSRREALVTALEIRAGSPPWGVTMLERYWRLRSLDKALRRVGRVGGVVRRRGGDAHFIPRPELLSLAPAGPLLGHRRRGRDGRRGAARLGD